ncbi:hypothetical protein [Salinarimonas soli]|uniref:Glycine zipper domain-containing protein n=1 Tax=Salinarimonas soli TaxID=1638099 RepID=A0A5B2V8C4_9HYPH|nr:hypothetical protein [Salinarimonas soli]KAA2234700.1 hypothetical protein F0L46_23335 [Salinarimonas soli]
MKSGLCIIAAAAIFVSSTTAGHAQDFGAMLGGAIGAAAGSRGGAGGAMVGGIIGVAMGTILQQLSQAEQQKRQSALQSAARGKSANWSSGKQGAKATYKNKGKVASADGRKCSKVEETITLPDGKRGTSVETVCFS